MKMKRPAVRITDNRPPRAGGKLPLEAGRLTRGGSMTGLDRLTNYQAKEQREHDKCVENYPQELLLAVLADLGGRRLFDKKDPEHRWGMARKAAALRKLDREGALK